MYVDGYRCAGLQIPIWSAAGYDAPTSSNRNTLIFHFLAVQIILGIEGVTFLLRMTWMSFLDARKPIDLNETDSDKDQRNFITGVIFSIRIFAVWSLASVFYWTNGCKT